MTTFPALSGALLHEPQLLILDEPLTGLDATIAREVKDLLLERAKGGCTIILTTHIMEVAERLVLIVKELRLIRRDPLLLMQLLQQSIYLLPLCLVLWRQSSGGYGAVPWLWLGMILVSGTLATALAWITIAAEDAPELALGRTQLWFAVSLALCAFGCSVSTALLQVYKPAAKRDRFKTRGRGSPGKGFLEMGLILSWIVLCALVTWVGVVMQRHTVRYHEDLSRSRAQAQLKQTRAGAYQPRSLSQP